MNYSKQTKFLGILLVLLSAWTMDLSAQNKRPAPAKKPAAKSAQPARPSAKPSSGSQNVKDRAGNGNGKVGSDNRGDRNINNNNVNIDKSRGDVNINVDNSKDIKVRNTKNTSVRRNSYRPYTRPPYVYGGFHYRCYNPYFYHPYRPFYWGPVWHPWGFFVATLATTAIIVSFADADLPPVSQTNEYFVMNNDVPTGPMWFDEGMAAPFTPPVLANEEYYYDEGVFYLKGSGGYTVVAAPVGGVVKTIPSGYETVVLDETSGVKNYYWGGTFFEKVSNGYKVVPPTSGAVVEHMADGGEEVKMGDVTYVKLGETYYQPIQLNGKSMYEVVDVEAVK